MIRSVEFQEGVELENTCTMLHTWAGWGSVGTRVPQFGAWHYNAIFPKGGQKGLENTCIKHTWAMAWRYEI